MNAAIHDKVTLALIVAIVLLMMLATSFVIATEAFGLDLHSEPLAVSVIGFLGATIAGLLAGLLARLTKLP